MQELSDEQMDELFRKSAEEFEPPFDSDHWQDMRRRLDQHDRGILWAKLWRWGTPMLLLLLLTGSYWFLQSPDEPSTRKEQTGKRPVKTRQAEPAEANLPNTTSPKPEQIQNADYQNTDSSIPDPSAGVTIKPKATPQAEIVVRSGPVEAVSADGQTSVRNRRPEQLKPKESPMAAVRTEKSRIVNSPVAGFPEISGQKPNLASRQNPGIKPLSGADLPIADKSVVRGTRQRKPSTRSGPSFEVELSGNNRLQNSHYVRTIDSAPASDSFIAKDAVENTRLTLPALSSMMPRHLQLSSMKPTMATVAYTDTSQPDNRPVIPVIKARERGLSIQFLVSPDLTTIGLKNLDRPGTNAGMLVQYRLSDRWSVQTGVMRSVKLYKADIEAYEWPSYYKWAVMPEGVSGRCNMLDIPVNIRYDFRLRPYPNKPGTKNRLFVSSGVTSYVMLRETYNYQYANPSDYRIKHWRWEGQTGTYKISNLNLSLGYESQFTRRLSWQAEPFIKMSLKPVGYFKARLLSTGAFFSLRYRL